MARQRCHSDEVINIRVGLLEGTSLLGWSITPILNDA